MTRLGWMILCCCLSGCWLPFAPGGEEKVGATARAEERRESAAPGARAVAKHEAVPDSVTAALLPALPGPLVAKPADREETRISIAVKDLPAQSFFQYVAQETPYSLVIHPEVSGTVTLNLKEVTVQKAVAAACELYGFDCRMTREGFAIHPRRLITRTFQVDMLATNRHSRSQTKISSGQTSDTVTLSKKELTSTHSAVSGADVITDMALDGWLELEQSLRGMLGLPLNRELREEIKEDGAVLGVPVREDAARKVTLTPKSDSGVPQDKVGRSVMINRQAGVVMVRAYPDELTAVADYLRQIARRGRRQVMLEAKILEVDLNSDSRFGIDWGAIHRGLSAFPPLLSEPDGGATFQSQPRYLHSTSTYVAPYLGERVFQRPEQRDGLLAPYPGERPFLDPSGGLTALINRKAGDVFSMALRAHDFTVFLRALEGQGKVHLLSNPKVAAVNNQRAVIKVGQDEMFLTDVSVKTMETRSGATLSQTEPQFRPFFSGVALDVVPQIGEDGVITLHLHPMVTEVSDKVKSFSFNDSRQFYPLAFSQSREADSVIRVRDGEVAVIGGLIKNDRRESEQKIPFLGDLPVVGGLFGHTSRESVSRELVILLRPTLIVEGGLTNVRWETEGRWPGEEKWQ